jgi:hypothetical protein
MRIGSVLNLFLFLILAVHAISGKPVVAAENVSLINVKANMVKLDDFFSVADKPVATWLKQRPNGTWNFDMEPSLRGAVAKVQMEDGTFVKMVEKGAKSGDISFDFQSEKATFTIRKLPNGDLVPVLFSKNLYADRFRFVLQISPAGGGEIYFLYEQKKPSK